MSKAFTEDPRFNTWLHELAAMQSTPLAENLFADDDIGKIRLANLKEYFRRIALLSPDVILIGEAPGYQGTRRTGVPFGSEYLITGNTPEVGFFGNGDGFKRAYRDTRTYKEPSSTIMWRTISAYRHLPLLWAVYPLHPHELGNLESNRTPTRSEVAGKKGHLLELLEIMQPKTVLALGNVAKATLDDLGIPSQKIRHPSHGGGPLFKQQLDEILL
jgi:hypothetical protein